MTASLPHSTAANLTFARVDAGAGRLGYIQRLALACVAAMICLSVTLPVITVSDSLWLKVEQLLLPVVVAIYAWMALTGFARPIRFNGMFLVGAVYTACVLLSLWYGAEVLHQSVLLRDFYEIPKAWLPVAYFTLAYEAELSERSLWKLLQWLAVATLLICLYAWAQWMNLSFTYTLNSIYSNGLHDDALLGVRRVYATFGNANVLAQLMNWTLAAFTLAALARIGNRLQNLGLALASLITLAMTGSRYGLLIGGLTLILIFVLPSQRGARGGRNPGVLLALIPLFAFTVWLVAASNPGTLERYQTLRDPAKTDSVRQRVDDLWRDAEDEFWQSPLLGRGPAKSIFTGIITDSEYLLILKEYGLVGFLAYLGYFLFPLALLWQGLRAALRAPPWIENRMPATFLTLRLSFIMLVTGLAMNLGMSTFLNMLLQGFFWLWLGLGARSAKTIYLVILRKTAGVGSWL